MISLISDTFDIFVAPHESIAQVKQRYGYSTAQCVEWTRSMTLHLQKTVSDHNKHGGAHLDRIDKGYIWWVVAATHSTNSDWLENEMKNEMKNEKHPGWTCLISGFTLNFCICIRPTIRWQPIRPYCKHLDVSQSSGLIHFDYTYESIYLHYASVRLQTNCSVVVFLGTKKSMNKLY